MTQPTGIPTLHFDGAALPDEVRLAAFARLTAYDVRLPHGTPVGAFQIDSRAWLLDDLVVHTSRLSALDIERTAAHFRTDGRDTYSFILLKDGGWHGELDEGEVQVGSGQVTVMDFARTWRVSGTAQENIMLVVPRAVAHAAAPDLPPLHGRVLDGASGRLFAEHLLGLVRHLPDMTPRDIPMKRQATLALLSGTLSALPHGDHADARHSHIAGPVGRVRKYIEERLTASDLDVAQICRDLAMTRPTLYRGLGVSGGVAAYIRGRRLEAAHAQIADMTERTSMAEIADRYCFSSHAHFSTAFRKHFGYAPRAARGTRGDGPGGRGGATADATSVFAGWSAQLGDG